MEVLTAEPSLGRRQVAAVRVVPALLLLGALVLCPHEWLKLAVSGFGKQ